MLNQNLLLTGDDGYNLTNSLRFRSSASAYLNRTFTNEQGTYTLSLWVKRGTLGVQQEIANSRTSGAGSTSYIEFNSSNQINIQLNGTSVLTTTAVYRDPASWYHIVLRVTSGATSYLYVNGTQIGSWTSGGNPFLFSNGAGYVCAIGRQGNLSAQYFDGYMAEINYIDGQALTPSSFGSTNALTGVWQPARYTGTYGTNGFYLPFTDNSALTTSSNVGLGRDYSGNGNYWTTNNISITAGVTYDSMTDVPTLTSATTANYCVLNPLNLPKGGTLSNGNLLWTAPSAEGQAVGTMYVSSGKFYWEMVLNTAGAGCAFGIASITTDINNVNLTAGSYVYYTNGNKYNGGSGSAYGATFTNGDIIGIALDLDAGTLVFYKNNTSQGTAFTGLSGSFTALIYDGTGASSPTFTANFGQRPFSYTPPTGFVALNTFNLPEPSIKAGNKQMDVSLYTGTGALTQTATNSGSMQPDFVWIKDRSQSTRHVLTDSVRGVGKSLYSSTTDSEGTDDSTGYLSAFNSNGFTVNRGSGGLGERVNYSGDAYVGWQWKAGGAAVTNTAGTISAQVSANTTSGFSVVTWVHSSTTSTIGHGLGVAPSFIILKSRTTAYNWDVGCNSIGWANRLILNSTGATTSGFWNSTAPTSSVFTYAGSGASNGDNMVAYCFAQIAGYSAFGSYTGNGSADGTFVYLGFRPRFILIRRTDALGGWKIYNTSGLNYNAINTALETQDAGAEATSSSFNMDWLSNGFKIRTTYTDFNASGANYIYMAFAENPFKYSLAR